MTPAIHHQPRLSPLERNKTVLSNNPQTAMDGKQPNGIDEATLWPTGCKDTEATEHPDTKAHEYPITQTHKHPDTSSTLEAQAPRRRYSSTRTPEHSDAQAADTQAPERPNQALEHPDSSTQTLRHSSTQAPAPKHPSTQAPSNQALEHLDTQASAHPPLKHLNDPTPRNPASQHPSARYP
ncbi:hypothetical protein B0O80DRAFT_431880 [Mortierella sp. GBAus27b]|nr:hypothetical protein B0O80DRAFT_431880 [Mortierella sp. GBAus27b]